MAYTITADIARMIEAGQKEVFVKNFMTMPPEWPAYTTRKTADKYTESYDAMGNLQAAAVKPEGGPINYGKITQAWQTKITNQTVANGFAHSFEAVRYDLYNVVNSAKAKELARTMREFEEATMIYWYDNATAVNLADGQPLASNSHPLANVSGVYNDTYATAGSITDPAVHEAMINMFHSFKNHQGGPMKSGATDGLTHFVNQMTVEKIYGSTNQAMEFSNTKNVLPKLRWHYTHYAAGTDPFMMWDRNYEHILAQWNMKTTMEHDKDMIWTKNMYFNSMAIYNSGCVPNVGIVYNDGA